MQSGVIQKIFEEHPLFERVDAGHRHTPHLMDPLEPEQPPPRKFRKISVDEDNTTPELLHDEHDAHEEDELGDEQQEEEVVLPLSPLAGKAPTNFLGFEPPIWRIGGPCPECGHVYKTTSGFENHCYNVHADEDVFMEYRPTKTEIKQWKKEEAKDWERAYQEGLGKKHVQSFLKAAEKVKAEYDEEWKGLEEGRLMVMRQVGRDFDGRVPWMNYDY